MDTTEADGDAVPAEGSADPCDDGRAVAVHGKWPPEGIGAIELEGRLLLVPPGGGELLVLNDTGRLVWEALAAGLAPGAVGEVLGDTFGIGRSRAQSDVEAIISRWQDAGIIGGRRATTAGSSGAAPAPCSDPVCARTYALCGRVVRVEFGTRLLEQALHPLLAPLVTAGQAPQSVICLAVRPDGSYVVARDGCGAEDRRALEDVIGVVINHLIDLAYPDARWLAIVHAGAVALGRRAIALAGVSGAGKSTLIGALVHAGCSYLSDDVVPLADTGHVMPVPFALCLKQGSWALLEARIPALRQARTLTWDGPPHRYVDLTSQSVPPGPGGVPLGAVVFPRYVPDAPLVARDLAPFAALERLLEARAWLSLQHSDLDRLFELLRATRAVELTYGVLDDAVRFIERHALP